MPSSHSGSSCAAPGCRCAVRGRFTASPSVHRPGAYACSPNLDCFATRVLSWGRFDRDDLLIRLGLLSKHGIAVTLLGIVVTLLGIAIASLGLPIALLGLAIALLRLLYGFLSDRGGVPISVRRLLVALRLFLVTLGRFVVSLRRLSVAASCILVRLPRTPQPICWAHCVRTLYRNARLEQSGFLRTMW